jgi:FHS family L-fucose permease-like MFS transporter
MTPAQITAYRSAEASTVKIPYLVIAGIFVAVAALIYFSHLPEIRESETQSETQPQTNLRGVLGQGHLVKGVLAQFFYVGAQVGVASFIIRFVQYSQTGTPEKAAADYLKLHLLGFMIGRFAGSGIMKHVPAARLLSFFALGALTCVTVVLLGPGVAPLWAIVFAGFFHSIMFPTIFALSIKHLGTYTKLGSSLLVMSIIGGAVVPAIMGYISDLSSIRAAFILPLICHAYILYFAVLGYRPRTATAYGKPVIAGAKAE